MRLTRLAGGLLALTTLGIGALAEPALALPVDGTDTLEAATQDQTTTETPEQKQAREAAEEDIRAAIGKAKLWASKAPCRDFFGTTASVYADQDAHAVLTNLAIDGVVNEFNSPGREDERFADVDDDGTITFFQGFFDKSENSELDQDRKLFDPPLSPEEWQAMVVLHELAHVFGKDHDDTFESVRVYEDALAKACFNSSKPPRPTPAPPPGGVGGGFGDGAIDSPSYAAPEIVFIDPLPDGDGDVTIGDITDWDVDHDQPEPLPDDTDPDDPCALDPLGCGGGGDYGGGYSDWSGGYDDWSSGYGDPWMDDNVYESELLY